MTVPARTRLRFALTLALGAAMFAVLAAPLPGEVTGCGGDASGKINASGYCFERCATEAQWHRTCGDIPDSDQAQEELEQYCAQVRFCDAPQICMGWVDYHISNQEASTCMDAILALECGVNLKDDPPDACREDQLCDPR